MRSSNFPAFEVYVADTVALIWYFADVFGQVSGLSTKATQLFDNAIYDSSPFIKIAISSVTFIEIFDKWITNESFAEKFYYEVYTKLIRSSNIIFSEIDQSVLEELVKIDGILDKHEINDKLILASAMSLNCSLITCDPKIKAFVDDRKVIPSILI